MYNNAIHTLSGSTCTIQYCSVLDTVDVEYYTILYSIVQYIIVHVKYCTVHYTAVAGLIFPSFSIFL